MTKTTKPTMPRIVADQLEEIRQSGRINMMNRNDAQVTANDMGFYAAVVWLEDNKKHYATLLFEGREAFEIIEDEDDSPALADEPTVTPVETAQESPAYLAARGILVQLAPANKVLDERVSMYQEDAQQRVAEKNHTIGFLENENGELKKYVAELEQQLERLAACTATLLDNHADLVNHVFPRGLPALPAPAEEATLALRITVISTLIDAGEILKGGQS